MLNFFKLEDAGMMLAVGSKDNVELTKNVYAIVSYSWEKKVKMLINVFLVFLEDIYKQLKAIIDRLYIFMRNDFKVKKMAWILDGQQFC